MHRSNNFFFILYNRTTANTSAIWQHAAHIANLLLPAAKWEPYKKAYLLMQNLKNFREKSQENGPASRKKYDRKSNWTWQKNKAGDSKVESNDSPEIPHKGKTSDVLGLPSKACQVSYGT